MIDIIDFVGPALPNDSPYLGINIDPIFFKGRLLLREDEPWLDVSPICRDTLDDRYELEVCTLYPMLSELATADDELLVSDSPPTSSLASLLIHVIEV